MTAKMTLLIKGDRDTALSAINKHDIHGAIFLGYTRNNREVVFHAPQTVKNYEQAIRWYCEPGHAPYPKGTLLFYGC